MHVRPHDDIIMGYQISTQSEECSPSLAVCLAEDPGFLSPAHRRSMAAGPGKPTKTTNHFICHDRRQQGNLGMLYGISTQGSNQSACRPLKLPQQEGQYMLLSLHGRPMLKTKGTGCSRKVSLLRVCTAMIHFVFQAEHRTMTAFILAVIVNSYTTGQVSITAAQPPQPLQEQHKGDLSHMEKPRPPVQRKLLFRSRQQAGLLVLPRGPVLLLAHL